MKIIPPISVEEFIDLVHKPSIREDKTAYRNLKEFYKSMDKKVFYKGYLRALERKRIYENQ